MIYRLTSVVILVFAMMSCGNTAEAEAAKTNPEIESLKKEIMKSHDVTMAEMGTNSKLRKKLKAEMSNSADSARMVLMYNELNRNHEAMMTWMHEFVNVDEKEWTDEQKMAYLEEQLEAVKTLEQYSGRAIMESKNLLEAK